ncbi:MULTISPECIES: aspartate carbamoyltransferase regulatory subunit [unclassified Lentimicrobium]|uniref:aspartate carbamoyltransferase regulatory subunit n=1 Tax=unclassified Lentimicrobium TaxID=2677434 RepID=UPI00155695C1|nr:MULTISPECIES: aspartate carbamoyltransferase regulatory subunit [unclassified Lentimicrobium]NPD44903.1 aspartate carbamoyltransferase regulatory subunit [Lentimicrobium sp. S6]NPD83729.1 aspartate carbamoyltransferase regulatory subunit [Lentimicrobium sp. L6]
MDKRKELKVAALENGTVIDHIPAASLFHALRILKLDKVNNQIYFGTNLHSEKYGLKGIIKIRDRYFKNEEINKIALVAPTATIIEIKDFYVVRKENVDTPEIVENFVKCFNPKCITNHQAVPTRFKVISDKGELKLRCHYCEKITTKDTMEFK